MKTKEQIREEWLQALESGAYKQTKDHLKKDNGFCCLGIACEVSKKELNLKIEEDDVKLGIIYYSGRSSTLPVRVIKYFGFRDDIGKFDSMIDGYSSLAEMNDEGLSFKEIAKHVRGNVDKVFVD